MYNNNFPNGPARTCYKGYTPSIVFYYQPGRKSFQQGYLGITGNASIVGFLQLKFPSNDPLYAKQIRLSFSGSEYIRLQETGPQFLTYGTNSICNITIELWKSDNGDYQEIRKLILPFEIPLPIDIPVSFSINKDRGKVEYNLRAIISRKPNIKSFQSSTLIAQCNYEVNRYILPPSIPEPLTYKDDRLKKGIGYEITINNKVFGPRYPIIVRVKLTFYDTRVTLESIGITLKEYTAITYLSKVTKKSRLVGRKMVMGRKIPISRDSLCKECVTDIKFTIPDDCTFKLNWSEESFNIIVSHKVKVKVRFGCFSNDNIKLEIPVKITNMLDEDEEARLAAELLYQQEISRYMEAETLQPRSDSPPPTYEPKWVTKQRTLPPSYSLDNDVEPN